MGRNVGKMKEGLEVITQVALVPKRDGGIETSQGRGEEEEKKKEA